MNRYQGIPITKETSGQRAYVTSYTEYVSKFGESFKSGSYYYEYLTSLAAKDFFNNGGQTLLVTRIISSGSANMSTYASATIPAAVNPSLSSSFVIETLAWGDEMNNTSSITSGALASGSTLNVRWEIVNVNTGSGTFSIAVRQGNDNTAQPNNRILWSIPSFTTSTHWPDYKVQTTEWNVENKDWKTDDTDDMFYQVNETRKS